MIAKCECQNCGQAVEFEAADFEFSSETSHRKLGQMINCPHCQQPTQIYMNNSDFIAPKKPRVIADLKEIWTDPKWLERQNAKQRSARMTACADCSAPMSRRALWCPACGSLQRSLIGLMWQIMGAFWFVGFVVIAIGWVILKLIEMAS